VRPPLTLIDKDEYPQDRRVAARVKILSHMWNAPAGSQCHRLLKPPGRARLHARREGAAVALAGPRQAPGMDAARPNW